jgi:hypothetical protein
MISFLLNCSHVFILNLIQKNLCHSDIKRTILQIRKQRRKKLCYLPNQAVYFYVPEQDLEIVVLFQAHEIMLLYWLTLSVSATYCKNA